jgi:hypothetical protein
MIHGNGSLSSYSRTELAVFLCLLSSAYCFMVKDTVTLWNYLLYEFNNGAVNDCHTNLLL